MLCPFILTYTHHGFSQVEQADITLHGQSRGKVNQGHSSIEPQLIIYSFVSRAKRHIPPFLPGTTCENIRTRQAPSPHAMKANRITCWLPVNRTKEKSTSIMFVSSGSIFTTPNIEGAKYIHSGYTRASASRLTCLKNKSVIKQYQLPSGTTYLSHD